jgi:hypothetical protein
VALLNHRTSFSLSHNLAADASAFQTGEQSTMVLDAISMVCPLEPSESSAEGKFESLFSHGHEVAVRASPMQEPWPTDVSHSNSKAGSRLDNQLTAKPWRIDETTPTQRARRRVYQTLGRGRGINDRRHVSRLPHSNRSVILTKRLLLIFMDESAQTPALNA